jgi:hypothetical protein
LAVDDRFRPLRAICLVAARRACGEQRNFSIRPRTKLVHDRERFGPAISIERRDENAEAVASERLHDVDKRPIKKMAFVDRDARDVAVDQGGNLLC